MANDQEQPREPEEESLARVQSASLAALSQLALQVDVRLGSTEITIGELLELRPGSALTMGGPVDAPVEVLVGNQVIARGELVAVEDELGVRITEIVARPEAEV